VKVLLDHCTPRTLRRVLPGHEIATARERGWDTLQNGDLLAAAEAEYDVMITCDQNLRYQQNLGSRRIALIVITTNHLPTVLSLAGRVASALSVIQPGGFVEIAP
jgi:predicted nuclease of predicted toxin-antitoxin system